MEVIAQEELAKIKQIKGEAIGGSLKEDFQFVLKKEGEAGLKRIEKEMEKFGCPLKMAEIKNFQWYPFWMSILLLVVNRNTFNWSDDVLRENGRFSAKVSVVMRIMVKYFISLERSFVEIGSYWRKYYTVGEVKTEELDVNGRQAIISLSGIDTHPVFCRILEGYVWQIFAYHVVADSLKVEEIECIFKGGKTHRLKLKW